MLYLDIILYSKDHVVVGCGGKYVFSTAPLARAKLRVMAPTRFKIIIFAIRCLSTCPPSPSMYHTHSKHNTPPSQGNSSIIHQQDSNPGHLSYLTSLRHPLPRSHFWSPFLRRSLQQYGIIPPQSHWINK